MSRKRSISTDISVDPEVDELAKNHGLLAPLLYSWAIPHADDFGRITGDARKFRLLVCPGLPITTADVDAALDAIASVGLWTRQDGVIQFPEEAWYRHQSYIPAAKRAKGQATPKRAESAADNRNGQGSPQNTEDRRASAQNPSSPSPSPSPTLSPTNPPTPHGNGARGSGGSVPLRAGAKDAADKVIVDAATADNPHWADELDRRVREAKEPVRFPNSYKLPIVQRWREHPEEAPPVPPPPPKKEIGYVYIRLPGDDIRHAPIYEGTREEDVRRWAERQNAIIETLQIGSYNYTAPLKQ